MPAHGEARLVSPHVPGLEPRAEELLLAAGEGIYGLDLQGRVTFVNPAAAQLTGHTPEELLGQPMHEVVHHSRADGRKLSRDGCAIHASFRKGEVQSLDVDVFWRKDGSFFPVEFRSTPIVREGKCAGAVVVFRDITARKRNENALARALAELSKHKDALVARNLYLEQELDGTRPFGEIIGQSVAIRELWSTLLQVAPTDSTVLVHGESGTGKELVARAIHRSSRRSEGPLVKLNCGAIPLSLLESELFGHERGAFTGANRRRLGRFELAHGGTLFLDEIGELPLEAQAKLLRVLQEREFERVGGTQTIPVDVRVVAATNRDLCDLIERGQFRQDLFYRLHVVPLRTPALRERKEDIPLLAATFVRKLAQRLARDLHGLSRESLDALMNYDWPGNVRELENVIERAAILADGPVITVHGLLPVPVRSGTEVASLPHSIAVQTLAERERSDILRALEQTNWKVAGDRGAGALLGLHPNTLRSRMKRLGLARVRAGA